MADDDRTIGRAHTRHGVEVRIDRMFGTTLITREEMERDQYAVKYGGRTIGYIAHNSTELAFIERFGEPMLSAIIAGIQAAYGREITRHIMPAEIPKPTVGEEFADLPSGDDF